MIALALGGGGGGWEFLLNRRVLGRVVEEIGGTSIFQYARNLLLYSPVCPSLRYYVTRIDMTSTNS